MANPRHDDKSTYNTEETARRTSEKTAEQMRRIGQTAADTGGELARSGADLLQQNAETLQSAWRLGFDMTAKMMERSTGQLGRALGVSGEEAQEATERSARNVETVFHSSNAISRGMSGASREYFELVRHQIETSFERMNDLWRCRTPQDVAAVQSELMRASMESFLEASRRIADISMKLADDAKKQMIENSERMQRVA